MDRLSCASVVFFAVSVHLGAQTLGNARDWGKQGIQQYLQARYQEAEASFQKALDLDPYDNAIRLYLAATYVAQWTPGASSTENLTFYDNAHTEYLKVLQSDPHNKLALASLASLAYKRADAINAQEKQAALQEAWDWNLRRTEVDLSDAEPYYYLGVIAWAKCFRPAQELRFKLHMRPEDERPLPDPAARRELLEACEATVAEGIRNLRHAIELNAQDGDAMSYLNLLFRINANYASSPEQAQQMIEEAMQWANRSLDSKKEKARRQNETPMTQQVSAPPGAVRISPEAAEANLLNKIEPMYPPLAMPGHIQGVVEFKATIGPDGRVQNLTLLRGHPLFIPAARDAVLHWTYRPTLLNGNPVTVMTSIIVPFRAPQ